ncbi:tRNA (adenosine(37)-N6)-threonylcarbamoyltransferase complex dimerization subunit type 1 TsaB [Orbaceae bacterium ESL0727]|nr:tRNA (adenosine(37)-N6)-threonylcarbamoyltransferase complex dimerization subunit type 1 TsaB [Orbaceae bacterium ESL0727]
MNTLLAIDTATEACSVALLYDNEITFDFTLSQRDHTKQILPMIDKLIKQAGCTLSQIDAIAFGQGPGSFTGVRIGIGVAQGLALGIDRPMIGVSTLMSLAQGAYRVKQASNVIAAIDARMGEIYLGHYRRIETDNKGVITPTWQPIIPECVIKPTAITEKINAEKINTEPPKLAASENYYFAGTGWQTYPALLANVQDGGILLPHAQDLIVIAQQKWQKQELMDVANIEPAYLRNEVTWKKLPGR